MTPEGVRVPGPRPGTLQLTAAADISRRRKDPSNPTSLQNRLPARAHPVAFSFDWSIDYYPRQYRRPGPEMSVYRLRGGVCGG